MNRTFRWWQVAWLALATVAAQAAEERGAVGCDQLQWSPQVLAENPDIALACRGVYQKDDVLYARARIEVSRVQGNTLRFRTLRTDGSRGPQRSVSLPGSFRVRLDGRDYRLSELVPGQELDIFLPEDRFSLLVVGDGGSAQAGPPAKIEK